MDSVCVCRVTYDVITQRQDYIYKGESHRNIYKVLVWCEAAMPFYMYMKGKVKHCARAKAK
eukprot:m.189962 g.189962  ORF g.189962 m.189962 type:complete len:61 (+) comp14803_c0_seq8:5829-6011(+)